MDSHSQYIRLLRLLRTHRPLAGQRGCNGPLHAHWRFTCAAAGTSSQRRTGRRSAKEAQWKLSCAECKVVRRARLIAQHPTRTPKPPLAAQTREPSQPHVRISIGIDLKSKGRRGTTWPTTAFYQVTEDSFWRSLCFAHNYGPEFNLRNR
jgi:hypothetical protein